MQMKSFELRIGNIILWDGDIYTVKQSFWDQYEDDESDIEFIPLNKDWMLKFGFELMPISEYTLDTYIKDGIQLWNKKGDFSELHFCYDGGNVVIKQVHQLQNLYFILKEKELTIKT